MKKHFIYLVIFLATLAGCHEVYLPEDLDWDEKIPVIQGKIVAGQTPEIDVYWAVDYEHDSVRYITDAQVSITDDLGNFVNCYPDSWFIGRYTSQLTGEPGRTYTLRVELSDGRVYMSKPQLLHHPPEVDSIYAIPGKHSKYIYATSGKPAYTHMQGLFINTAISDNYQTTLYYRFSTKFVRLSSYIVGTDTPFPYSVYKWETAPLDNSYSVNRTATINNRQLLLKHPVGFLRYFYDYSLQTSSRTAPYTECWVVIQKVYSISGDVYDYYRSLGNIMSGNNRIFAPVASQLKNNIFCVSDPKEKVVGVFEASSLTTVYRAFKWHTLEVCKSRDLDYYPDVGYGEMERFAPDFWIYF